MDYIINKDGTIFLPPVPKEFDQYAKLLCGDCEKFPYKCFSCNRCAYGSNFDWPETKRQLLRERATLNERYFKLHNPNTPSIKEGGMERLDTYSTDEEYDVIEKKHHIFGFNILDGIISFDLHLPAIYSNLFDVFRDPADATVEDLKYIKTVLHWKTNIDDEYSTVIINSYGDDQNIICLDRNQKNVSGTLGAMICIGLDMGRIKFRMPDCYMEGENYRFPEEAKKFIVAVTMERMY